MAVEKLNCHAHQYVVIVEASLTPILNPIQKIILILFLRTMYRILPRAERKKRK